MASSYALPAVAISQHHHPVSEHSYSHAHSHSHTSSLGSLSPTRNRKDSRASGTHYQIPIQQHNGNHSSHRANSNVPVPLNLASAHWRTESTPGGKTVVTPTAVSFDAAGVYEAPVPTRSRSHSHSHHHHDHSAERSRLTALLLPYTSKWPVLHAVVADKDSRRIFYFMRFVACSDLPK
jgi:zinc transporter 5/7